MSEDRPAIQVNMVMLAGIMKAYKGEPPWGTPYYHMSREEAYGALKRWTKQDFGDDYEQWEEWLEAHNYVPVLTDEELARGRAIREALSMPKDEMLEICSQLHQSHPDEPEHEVQQRTDRVVKDLLKRIDRHLDVNSDSDDSGEC